MLRWWGESSLGKYDKTNFAAWVKIIKSRIWRYGVKSDGYRIVYGGKILRLSGNQQHKESKQSWKKKLNSVAQEGKRWELWFIGARERKKEERQLINRRKIPQIPSVGKSEWKCHGAVAKRSKMPCTCYAKKPAVLDDLNRKQRQNRVLWHWLSQLRTTLSISCQGQASSPSIIDQVFGR